MAITTHPYVLCEINNFSLSCIDKGTCKGQLLKMTTEKMCLESTLAVTFYEQRLLALHRYIYFVHALYPQQKTHESIHILCPRFFHALFLIVMASMFLAFCSMPVANCHENISWPIYPALLTIHRSICPH